MDQKKLRTVNPSDTIDYVISDDNVFAIGTHNDIDDIKYHKAPYVRLKLAEGAPVWLTHKIHRYETWHDKISTYYEEGLYNNTQRDYKQADFYPQYNTQFSGKTYYCYSTHELAEPKPYGRVDFLDTNAIGEHQNLNVYHGYFPTITLPNPVFGLMTEDSPYYESDWMELDDNGFVSYITDNFHIENNTLYVTNEDDGETTTEAYSYNSSCNLTISGETYNCYVSNYPWESMVKDSYYVKSSETDSPSTRMYMGYAQVEELSTTPILFTSDNINAYRDATNTDIDISNWQTNSDGAYYENTVDYFIRKSGYETTIDEGTGWRAIDLQTDGRYPIYSGVSFNMYGNNTTIGSIDFRYIENISDGMCSGCTNLTTVTFDKHTKSIGEKVFYNCTNLVSVDIPDGITTIGQQAFYQCSSLENVTLPDSMTQIPDKLFYNCTSLTTIDIPESITVIGEGAFQNCSSLISVDLPDGLTEIADNMFYGCHSISSVTIPSSVKQIGSYAFSDCRKLDIIDIPLSVTEIGENAFEETSLDTFTVHENLNVPTTYEDYEFEKYYDFGVWFGYENTDVFLPSEFIWNKSSLDLYYFSNSFYTLRVNKLVLGDNVTSWSGIWPYNIPNVVMNNNLTYVPVDAFRGDNEYEGSSDLTAITLGNNVQEIRSAAFKNCAKLTHIEFPASLTCIQEEAFWGCRGLKSLVLPEGLRKLGREAFSGCLNLESITIPSTCTDFPQALFHEYDENLTAIYYKGPAVPPDPSKPWDAPNAKIITDF